MDATNFDDLVKRLSTTSLTRLKALRGLAAGAAALAGAQLAAESGAVRNRNNNDDDDNERKRRICHCGNNNPTQTNCKTLRLERKKAKRHLKRHANDYKSARQ